MTYEEAIAYIHGMYWRGSKLGLVRVTELCHLLGDPQNTLKFIHVAGTNGKGSTCAMLSKILCAQGYNTGLFVSPYVDRFNERIQLNNAPTTTLPRSSRRSRRSSIPWKIPRPNSK